MSTRSKLLLLDLLKIKEEYEDKDIIEVMEVFKHKRFPYLVEVLQLLKELDQFSPSKESNKPKANKTVPSTGLIESMSDTNPEKYILLSQMQEILLSKEVFKTVKDLQAFVSEKVHLTAKKNTRQDLINKYLSQFTHLSVEELENEVRLLNEKSHENDSVSKFLDMANEIVKSRKKSFK